MKASNRKAQGLRPIGVTLSYPSFVDLDLDLDMDVDLDCPG
jgi:hypothetical protein